MDDKQLIYYNTKFCHGELSFTIPKSMTKTEFEIFCRCLKILKKCISIYKEKECPNFEEIFNQKSE